MPDTTDRILAQIGATKRPLEEMDHFGGYVNGTKVTEKPEILFARLDMDEVKAKAEEIQKFVENALRKAGINPAHVDSDDHIESNMAKGWITAEDAAKAREIKASAAAEAEANLEKQAKKIEMISQGRLQKYFKENTLMDQIYVGNDDKLPVKEFLAKNKITCLDFKRITLNQE